MEDNKVIYQETNKGFSLSGCVAAFFSAFILAFTVDWLIVQGSTMFAVRRFIIAVAAAVIITVLYIVLMKMFTCQSLTITQNEILGKTGFFELINIPLADVTTVQLTSYLFKGISVGTNLKKVSFYFLRAPQEAHQAIHRLVLDRQLQETKNFAKQQEELKEQTEALLKKAAELTKTEQENQEV